MGIIPIYIPSLGRWSYDHLRHGPLTLLHRADQLPSTTVVVHIKEAASYKRALEAAFPDCGLRMAAIDYDGIAEKRERIGQMAAAAGHDCFMMLDDDINFLRRASHESASQRTMTTGAEVREMLWGVDSALDSYQQVALGLREVNRMAVRGPPPLLDECSRAIRAVAWDTRVFNSLRHRRVRCMEDHDLTLQLLESGQKNAVLWYWMSGQPQTSSTGGCSAWRTREVHDEAARELHRLHPDVTKLRQVTNKGGGGLSTRTEVTIYWKKAHRNGTARTTTAGDVPPQPQECGAGTQEGTAGAAPQREE